MPNDQTISFLKLKNWNQCRYFKCIEKIQDKNVQNYKYLLQDESPNNYVPCSSE